MAQDLRQWLRTNPAAPAFPTTYDPKRWRSRVVRRLGHSYAPVLGVPGRPGPSRRSIPLVFEPTPWGGMERVALTDARCTGVVLDAVRITVLAPPTVHGRRDLDRERLLRRRTSAELGSLRPAHSIDPWVDLPGRRPAVDDPRDVVRRADARRVVLDRARHRALVATTVSATFGLVVATGLDGSGPVPEVLLTTLVIALVATGLAVLAPALAAYAGRHGSRSFAVVQDDPRYVVAQVLAYHCAHREAIGPRADELVSLAWRTLHAAAEADVTAPVVRAELDRRARDLVEQSWTVTAEMNAREELERLAARPLVRALEREADARARATLRALPSRRDVDDLTREIRLDLEAQSVARARLSRSA